MNAADAWVLDLRGTPCPVNFVRTKLKLSQMTPGQTLTVWLDAGEPIEQVPHSLALEGYEHQVLTPLEPGPGYRLTIQVPDSLARRDP
jgi:TusA-related sulfurtransferase